MRSPPQVFLAVRRMLDDIGADAPVVLILEDLHWADPSTLDLVRHLGQAPSGGPPSAAGVQLPVAGAAPRRAVVAAAGRGDVPAPDRAAGAARLRPGGVARVPGRGKRRPGRPELVERCLDWSEGIPFYAEQLMAAGALDNPEDVELPDDMRDVILVPAGRPRPGRRSRCCGWPRSPAVR